MKRDRRGVASIEFVFVMPMLITCLMGVVEVTQLYRAQIKVFEATDMLAKMLAQQGSVTKAQLKNLCYGVQMAVTPLSGASYAAAIASVTNQSGTVAMDWEYDQACTAQATSIGSGQAIALATGNTNQVSKPGNSILIVTGTYPYVSPFRFFLTNQLVLTATSQPIPRSTTTIACTDC